MCTNDVDMQQKAQGGGDTLLIFAIDDEPKMLRLLHRAIEEVAPEAQIMDFPSGSAALSAMEQEILKPSVIFTDIRMPKVDGLELAVRLKVLSPETKIIFVTGHEEYAIEAYRLHASGYVLKPVDEERIKEELSNVMQYLPEEGNRLEARCFGYFEVFWQKEPLPFVRRQTKELLAYLIDRRGSACMAEEVITDLYESVSPDGLVRAKHSLRNLVSDLRSTLRSIGMEDVLVRKGSMLAIRPELIDCDYYRMLEGDMTAVNAFRGQYMEQYSWAEITKGSLQFERIIH